MNLPRYTYLATSSQGLLCTSQKYLTREEAESAAERHAGERGAVITHLEIVGGK